MSNPSDGTARVRVGLLAVLLCLAAAEGGAEEALGAASLRELVSTGSEALNGTDLAAVMPLLVESERTVMALAVLMAALERTPQVAQRIAGPEASADDLLRLAERDPEVAELRLIFERRGLGHFFGTAPEPWDEPLVSTDPDRILQRLQASVGRDPVGLVADLQGYLERFRGEDGSGPLDAVLAQLPRGDFRDVEVQAGPDGPVAGSAQTDAATVRFVREGDRWFMKIWDVRLEATPRR